MKSSYLHLQRVPHRRPTDKPYLRPRQYPKLHQSQPLPFLSPYFRYPPRLARSKLRQ